MYLLLSKIMNNEGKTNVSHTAFTSIPFFSIEFSQVIMHFKRAQTTHRHFISIYYHEIKTKTFKPKQIKNKELLFSNRNDGMHQWKRLNRHSDYFWVCALLFFRIFFIFIEEEKEKHTQREWSQEDQGTPQVIHK